MRAAFGMEGRAGRQAGRQAGRLASKQEMHAALLLPWLGTCEC